MKNDSTRLNELKKVLNQNLVKDSVVGFSTIEKLKIETRDVILTPALARFFLNRSLRNRPIDTARRNQYIADLKDGKWVYDGNPIQFDYNGNLINGHHRCLAVELSGVTQVFKVITGVHPDSFLTADQGKRRTGADATAIAGYDNAKQLSATAYFVYNVEKKVIGARAATHSRQKMRNADLLVFLDFNPTLVDSVNFYMDLHKNKRIQGNILQKQQISGFHFLFSKKDKKMADEFLSKLLNGENLLPDSPILYLRNKLVNHLLRKNRSTKLDTSEINKLVALAWNKHRTGETVKALKVPTEMPELI